MTLRTRRRISPRTKRRYRAIRNFFRRTLGSIASQPDIKINSSIAVNVTDLKHKIVGIGNQQDEVCKHCHNIVSCDNISRKDVESFVPTDGDDINSTIIQKDSCSDKSFAEKDTELQCKTSENHSIKAGNRDSLNYFNNEPININLHSSDTMNHDKYYANHYVHKPKTKKGRRDFYDDKFEASHRHLRKNRTKPDPDSPDLYDDNSYLSLRGAARSDHRGRRQICPEEHTRCPVQEEVQVKRHKDKVKRNKSERITRIQDDRRGKTTESIINPVTDELDLNFISDLIQRQYKPVKIFDTRSNSSEVSSPVCRDNEFSKPDVIAIGSEMCSCCAVGRSAGRRRGPALHDMRSLCDTRLYSSRRRAHSRPHDNYADAYNDSNLYDVVPVKEKSSPKSRRKFVEDNMCCEHFEVPPSPRTHRPRLNLQAQNYDYSDGSPRIRSKQSRRNRSPKPYQQRKPECADSFRSEVSSDESIRIKSTGIKRKPTKNAEIQEDMGTMSSFQYPEISGLDKTNTTFNDTLNRTESNNDKTDKALSEIKDILQSFLQEIKQKASTTQCDNSGEVIGKTDGQCCEELHDSPKITPSVLQNSGHENLAGNEVGNTGPPAGPPLCLASPYCCRVVPVCPCVHNFLGSPTCSQCQSHTHGYNESDAIHGTCKPKEINETDNLIREIYKYVAQNNMSTNMRKTESSEINRWRDFDEINTKELTSKCVGKSNASRHDAGVGTQMWKSYSKSCEALSTRAPRDVRERSAASHSDTGLETTGFDATMQSTTNYETTTTNEVSLQDKGKKCKFVSVLQSFGLLKKYKKTRKDIIDEESETETTKVNEKAKQKYPFRQDLTNYMMHTQEFYHRPPSPPPRRDRLPSPPYDYGYPPYDYRMNDRYDPYREHMRARASAPPYGSMRPEATAPPYPCPCTYDPHCSHNMHPQVPLCLKEVEVKSTGTQSEKGVPFFRKFSQRKPARTGSSPQPSRDDDQKTYGTQTAPGKPGLFASKWKDLQSKAAGKKFDFEPFAYSYNDQQKLAQGDEKMRAAMLKKLFPKRNPFSPRNLIARTLMGNDRASWGFPPAAAAQRPRMFF